MNAFIMGTAPNLKRQGKNEYTPEFIAKFTETLKASGGSADYSVQAFLTTDGKQTRCVSEYHTEVGTEGVTRGYLRDPRSPSDGASWPNDGHLRTVVVERNAETQLGTVFARPQDRWVQCGRPRRFPFGGLGVDLKTYGRGLDVKPAVARWDNYRIYPRPASHYVGVRLASRSSQPINGSGLSVQLLDVTGRALVLQARVYRGRCLLSLKNAPWIGYPVSCKLRLVRERALVAEGTIQARGYHGATHVPIDPEVWDTYPACALVKVYYLDKQVGQPVKLSAKGIDGLYPGSLWHITIK